MQYIETGIQRVFGSHTGINTNEVQVKLKPSEKYHQYINGGVPLEFRNEEEGGGNQYLTVNLTSEITTRGFQKLIKEAAKLNFKARDIQISCSAGEVTKPLLKDNVSFVSYVSKHNYFQILIRDYFKKYTDEGVDLEFRVEGQSRHNEYVTVNLNSEITTRDFQKLIKEKAKLKCKSRNIAIFCSVAEVSTPLLKDNVVFVNYVNHHRSFHVEIRNNQNAY